MQPVGSGWSKAALQPTPPAPTQTVPARSANEAAAWPDAARYNPSGTPRRTIFALIALLHVAAILVAISTRAIAVERPRSVPLVVELLPLDSPRPPEPDQPLPTVPKPEIAQPKAPKLVIPQPSVQIPAVVPVAAMAPTPPTVPEPQVSARPSEPLSANLALKLIIAKPPSYPVASRRAREEGVVVLELVLGEDGSVDEISIKSSSGSNRLDKAALSAVKRWRWSSTIVDGKAVRVRGLVRIPFELRG